MKELILNISVIQFSVGSTEYSLKKWSITLAGQTVLSGISSYLSQVLNNNMIPVRISFISL